MTIEYDNIDKLILKNIDILEESLQCNAESNNRFQIEIGAKLQYIQHLIASKYKDI